MYEARQKKERMSRRIDLSHKISTFSKNKMAASVPLMSDKMINVLQLARNRRRWTPQQREQSEKFWELKRKRELRKKEQQLSKRLFEMRKGLLDELSFIQDAHLVSGPAGKENPIPEECESAFSAEDDAQLTYSTMMENITSFLNLKTPVQSLYSPSGIQLIQQSGNITKRVGIDVIKSAHVEKLGPHLNLQVQEGGEKLTDIEHKDPHLPIKEFDPFSSICQDKTFFLKGKLTLEEQRKFVERYLHSLGIDVLRSDAKKE